MTSKKPPLPLLKCSNCGEDNVKPRRKSTSGMHWCSARECQNAKVRHYSKMSREAAKEARAIAVDVANELPEAKMAFSMFLRASYAERVTCSACGLNEAIAGYPHFDAEGGNCAGTYTNRLPPSQAKHLHPDMIRVAIANPTYQEA